MRARWWLSISLLALAGCTGTSFGGSGLPEGAGAYSVIPAGTGQASADDYRIGELDRLDINIFQEPDLSGKGIEVNAAGKIAMPLIGDVTAAGTTGPELAARIAGLYGARLLEHPKVSVTIARSVSQKVVIQGEVTEPGVYEIKGRATLLEAISMAKGETRYAATREVAIFRTVNGQRTGALFDVEAIRRGQAGDPQLLGSDVVVVGLSRSRNVWRDVLATAPFLAVFRPLGY